jgi:hypothetical protein
MQGVDVDEDHLLNWTKVSLSPDKSFHLPHDDMGALLLPTL